MLTPLIFTAAVHGQNYVNSTANTGGNQQSSDGNQSLTTGDASAKSEITNKDGQVSGHLEVVVNGDKKTLEVTGPGQYKLELNQSGSTKTVATGQATIKKEVKKTTENFLRRLFRFIFQLFGRDNS